MKWFKGSITEAIQKSKSSRAVFIVYVEGNDDASKQMSGTWEEDSVSAAFDDNDCVCLKLEANSDACAQFSAFYPVVCVPCTFFIGVSGSPLEVTGGAVSAQEIKEKLVKVTEMNDALKSPIPSPQQEVAPSVPPVQEDQKSKEPVEEKSSEPSSPSSEQAGEASGAGDTAQAGSSTSPEDKVERARRLLAEKQRQKAQEEKEKAKEKERERREMGKGMTDLKRWQKEQKQKEDVNEWKKEKEEARKHRELVRQQIARDRAERAAKFQREKEERNQEAQEKQAAKEKTQSEEQARVEAIKRETARIQFRLPDGSSITEQFASSETLGAARVLLRAKIGNAYSNFSLSTLYPKRDFTEADMSSTLLDLQLAPSAVIIVVPISRMSMSQSGNGEGGGFIWMLFAPFIALFNFIFGFIFASPPQQSQVQAGEATNEQQQQQQQQQRPEQSSDPQTSVRQRPKSSYGFRSRQEGNIHRFSADDDDDDMSTWNGNSTQQM